MEKKYIFIVGEAYMPRHVLFLLEFYSICISIEACDRREGKVISLLHKRLAWLQLPLQNKTFFRDKRRSDISYVECMIQILLFCFVFNLTLKCLI